MRIIPELVFSVIYYESAHFLFGACVSLAVALLAYLSISIIYRVTCSALPGCPTSSLTWERAGFYILLLSLAAAVCSHVLEDIFIAWF
jgi:hypothetical protein